jgi:tetratricopeptide (TPR) repeat protein
MRARVAAAVLVLAAAFPARVAAAPSEAERTARSHFQAGEARFKAGAFDEALKEYQAGYDAKPLPGFLVNIAQCQRRLGDLKTARATYQKFVLVAPDSPLVPQVRSMITEIDGLLANLDAGKPAAEPEEEAKPAPAEPPASTLVEKETPAPVLVKAPDTENAPEQAAPRHRWWLWGVIGAVVVGGAVTALVLTTGGTTTIHDGSLATLRR